MLKKMKRYLTTIIGTMMLTLIMVSCQHIEQPHRYFDSYSKQLHKGNWVPDIFPKDIKQINEQHDIDTNEVWLSYTPGKSRFDPLQYGIVVIPTQEIETINFRFPYQASWWFEEPIEQQLANDNALNAVTYRGINEAGGKTYFTCDFEKNKCYWWSN